jgi:hypothetical protein
MEKENPQGPLSIFWKATNKEFSSRLLAHFGAALKKNRLTADIGERIEKTAEELDPKR